MARTKSKFTQQFANLQKYYQETWARYLKTTNWEERQHLFAVLQELLKQTRQLIADYMEAHRLRRRSKSPK